MSGVFLSSATNSTMFTQCCSVAICNDESKCPSCREDVYPFYDGMSDEDRAELSLGAYSSPVGRRRWRYAYSP